jgi:hypothetical protein
MKAILTIIALAFFSVSTYSQGVRADKHPEFKNIVQTMRSLANFKKDSVERNTVYVSNVAKDERGEFAYAYWKEDKSITILRIPLTVPLQDDSPPYYWLTTKARIDLQTDVVPTKDDMGGSSFLVDRAWVNSILKRCVNGVRLRY